MKKILFMLSILLGVSGTVRAQWVTFDPSNLAQSIVNSSKEIVETSSTAQTMLQNFNETVKIYQQGVRHV